MGLKVEMIKPKPLKRGAMRDSIIAAAQKAAIDMAKDMTKITKGGWKDPVEFVGRVKVKRNDIEVTALPRSPRAKNAKIFSFVDKGTKPHKIRPKRKKALSFTSGYKAGSRPNRVTTTSSKSFGSTVFAQEVNHPGTEPRNWTKTRYKKWKKKMPKYLEAGMKVAAKKSGHYVGR